MKPRPTLLFTLSLWLLACISSAASASDKKVVCYFTNWSAYRPGNAKFTASNINPYLCTHLVYAFVGMDNDFLLKPFDKWQDIDQGAYAKFNGLKTFNKDLKTLLAIGGWNEGSKRFTLLAEDEELRANFTKSVVRYLRQYNFDGFDLDWEYPGSRDGGRSVDKANYLQLVKDLREAFELESKKSKRPRLLLTMAVPAGIDTIDKGYDIAGLSQQLDFFNMLTYDYHASTEPVVNHHSPLKSHEDEDFDFENQLTVDYTVRYYLKKGAPRHKLVVGIPTYGRSFKLFNPDVTSIGSPSEGPSEASKYTKEKGYMAYYEICEKIGLENWLIEKPYPEAIGPYAYSEEGVWVGYDDEDMVARKANYVLEENLGGVMFWSLETDDFRGVCTGKQFPLLEAAVEALSKGSKVSEGGKSSTGVKKLPKVPLNNAIRSNSLLRSLSSAAPTEQLVEKQIVENKAQSTETSKQARPTPPPPPTPAPDADFTCKGEGFFPHPTDCKRYFRCLDAGALGIIANSFVCPSGLHYNKLSSSCDYTTNVICKPTPPPTFKPFLAQGTSLATRPTTTTTEPTFVEEEEDEYSFEEKEIAEKSEEVAKSEEDNDNELEKLLDLIRELGGISSVKKLLDRTKSSPSDSGLSNLQRESLQKFLDTSSKGTNSRTGPVGGSVPKEILAKTDFDPTFNQHDTKPAKPKNYQTITRSRAQPSTTTEEPTTTTTTKASLVSSSEELEDEVPIPVRNQATSPSFVRTQEEVPAEAPIIEQLTDEAEDVSYEDLDEYDDAVIPIKAPPKSVNLQRRPPAAVVTSEEEEEIPVRTSTTTTTEATTTTITEPTTTRKVNIRPPTRKTPKPTTTTTTQPLVVERTSIGPIRFKPTTTTRKFASRPRSTTPKFLTEEVDEEKPASFSEEVEDEIPVSTRKPSLRVTTPVQEDTEEVEVTDVVHEVSFVPSTTIVQDIKTETERPIVVEQALNPTTEKPTVDEPVLTTEKPVVKPNVKPLVKTITTEKLLAVKPVATTEEPTLVETVKRRPILVRTTERTTAKPTTKTVRRLEPFARVRFSTERPVTPRRLPETFVDPLLSDGDSIEYFDDTDIPVNVDPEKDQKIQVVNGKIRCLDVGSFAHPDSCKRFINCARVDSGALRAWVYTCPEELSFDPVGGLCNWGSPQRCQQ